MSNAIKIVRATEIVDQLSVEFQEFAQDPKNCIPALVAMDGDAILAIGSLARNLLHPEPRYFHYLLNDNADVNALTHLVETIVRVAKDDGKRAIHVTLNQSDTRLTSWAESAGFRPIMTTWTGVLPPIRSNTTPPLEVRKLRRLADDDTLDRRRELAILHAQIYREQHRWNPAAPIAPEMAESLFMEDSEVLPELMWYSVDELGRATGVSSLRSTARTDVVEFGWIGVLPGVEEFTHTALFDTAVRAVGRRLLVVELDEADPLTLGYFSKLPVDWRDPQIRYERPR